MNRSPSGSTCPRSGRLRRRLPTLVSLLEIESGPVPGDPSALPYPFPMPGGRPARAIAAPRLVDFGPLPEPVQTAFDAALGALERDTGLPIERIEPAEIFRAGNPSEDWLLLC